MCQEEKNNIERLKFLYRKQIDDELKLYGFVDEDLSNDEMLQLIGEIKCREEGGDLLDGVLWWKSIHDKRGLKFYRDL